MNQKYLALLTIAFIHTAVCLVSGGLGWNKQFLIVQNASIVSLLILHFRLGISLKSVLLVTMPFYIIYASSSIYLRSYETFPIWISGLLTVIVAYLMFKSRKFIYFSAFLLAIQVVGVAFVMPNNFALLSIKANPSRFGVHQVNIINSSDEPFKPTAPQGKIMLFDVWHSSCGVCIRKFPELQKLHDDFKNDTTVAIYSLNIPLNSSDRKVSDSIIAAYNFGKLYFKSREESQKLQVSTVPLILILHKKGICRYAGGLNTEWNIIIGNAKSIIKKLKQES